MAALLASPSDQEKAMALAQILLARADADSGFERALREWWLQAAPVREAAESVTNTASGIHYGPVLQGRDFTNVTFSAIPPPAPAKGDPGGSR